MTTRRQRVLGAIDQLGEAYSREVATLIDGCEQYLRNTIPWVQRELRTLEGEGVLVSRLVSPGPSTFRGGMLRRYYKRAP